MEDFDDLAEEMHRRDLKLIMNMVLNHASDEHAWFKESRASRTSPKKDWYHRNGSEKNKSPNDCLSYFSGSVWEWDEPSGGMNGEFSSGHPWISVPPEYSFISVENDKEN